MRAHSSLLLIASLTNLTTSTTPPTNFTTTLTQTVYLSCCTSTTSQQNSTQTQQTFTNSPKLDLREIVVDQGGNTITATQYPIETTAWSPHKIDGVITWLPDVYTQTFATTVLDQLPGPLEGKIGTERVELPQATGGVGVIHETSDAGGREDGLDDIWWVTFPAGMAVSLVAGFVVF